jgi:DNA-binding NarL/FixJ family response regulator
MTPMPPVSTLRPTSASTSSSGSNSTSLKSVSVLLVDDESRFRQGMRTLLSFYSANKSYPFTVVGEAASADQAVELAIQQHPSLILLDLELPPNDGISVLLKLQECGFRGKVLILSGHREDESVFRAMQAGACGYVLKDRLANQLCDAISTVLEGGVYLSPEVSTGFFRMFQFYTGRIMKACHSVHLTEREQEVLHWLVQGASNDEIAQQLYITVATVKAHLTAIFEKLQVASRTQAIVKALKLGLVSA